MRISSSGGVVAEQAAQRLRCATEIQSSFLKHVAAAEGKGAALEALKTFLEGEQAKADEAQKKAADLVVATKAALTEGEAAASVGPHQKTAEELDVVLGFKLFACHSSGVLPAIPVSDTNNGTQFATYRSAAASLLPPMNELPMNHADRGDDGGIDWCVVVYQRSRVQTSTQRPEFASGTKTTPEGADRSDLSRFRDHKAQLFEAKRLKKEALKAKMRYRDEHQRYED